MPVVRKKWITRSDLKNNPDRLFVFGDNMLGRGLGGQAKEMRGEVNAVGVPTKWAPSMAPSSFFVDDDLDRVKPRIEEAFSRLREHLRAGGTVVFPFDGIGTGLAQLAQAAPSIALLINEQTQALIDMSRMEVKK